MLPSNTPETESTHGAPSVPVVASVQPHGTFAEDLQRWADIWIHHPGKRATLLERAGLVWTHLPLRATALLRLSALCSRRHIPLLPGMLHRLNVTLHGLDIVPNVPIGGGLYLPHTVGTVVMARQLGSNVTLVSGVTIGMRNELRFPRIGNNVYVGAGARILGAVTVGDGATIGANSVVLTDVPAGATAVGVPARIIERRQEEGGEER
ncbi:MAG: serine O-acetyltransferase [Chloroflexota bacterium]